VASLREAASRFTRGTLGGIALLLACCAAGLPAWADNPPQDALAWLTAMRDARKTLNFHGTATLLRGSQVQMVSVAHGIIDGVVYDSMRSLDDPSHAEIHRGCPQPGGQRNAGGIGALPDDLAAFQRFYRYSLGPPTHLIGRQAQEIALEPLDAFRYGRRFWIDADSKLPLKYQLFNGGNTLEQLVFSELQLDAAPVFTPKPSAGTAPAQASQPLESLQWRLQRVPPGYRLVSYMRHSPPGKPELEHLLLSDGFAAVSLYLEPSEAAARLKKQVRHVGAMHFYLRPLGAYQLTVMGEAPLAAVTLIGDNVQRVRRP
jgi:sigma-E factor negative regulatory protein RseB